MTTELTIREASGFLFIGDPHLCSEKPGRRKETKDEFSAAILGKIEQVIVIANDRRLIPVFLGDMFDKPREINDGIKTRLLRILRKCWTKPIVLVGNHDRKHAYLSDEDTLATIGESGVIDLITSSGPIGEFILDGVHVGLGGTPHLGSNGTPENIPTDVTGLFSENVRGVIWLTHHDIGFEGAYPGAIMPFEIKGCRLVVNGHMHLTKEIITEGETNWFNPGNLTRQALDAINHIPRVWEFSPTGSLQAHDLIHETDVFNLTGRLTDVITVGEAMEENAEDFDSAFVDLLREEAGADLGKTHDGSVILEDIERKFSDERTPADVQVMIRAILKEVVEEEEKKKVA
jgi:hypothetical protein